jgi:hypothetical protein
MTDTNKAIQHLKENGVAAFEHGGIVVVPCDSPEEILDLASKVKRLFKEIDFQKSWEISPYILQPEYSVQVLAD